MRIAVCDDIKETLDFLCAEIGKQFTEHNIEHVIEAFGNGADFLAACEKRAFDVIFLDIVMPDMNGFEVAEKVREASDKTYIIFVTTEDTLVYDSFSFQPFDFIPKNYGQNAEFFDTRLKSVIQRLADKLNKFKKISLPQPYGQTLFVEQSDILFVKTSGNYVEYIIKGWEPVKVRAKLDEVEKELEQSIFLRLHKSYIVNMDFIKTINYSELLAVLKDNTIVTISKAHKKNVEARYMNYIRGLGR